jgi:hypothetical protein
MVMRQFSRVDGVDDHVHRIPDLGDLLHGALDLGVVRDVEIEDGGGVQRLHERDGAPAHGLARVGEDELGALGVKLLGDGPGDAAVVGDPGDEDPLPLHQSVHDSLFPAGGPGSSGTRGLVAEGLDVRHRGRPRAG